MNSNYVTWTAEFAMPSDMDPGVLMDAFADLARKHGAGSWLYDSGRDMVLSFPKEAS